MKIKRLTSVILTIVMFVIAFSSLCACECKHVWQDATCTTPKTCTICGATEGEALGHQWKEGRKLCLVCGLDERTVDEKFIDALAEGLNDRWAVCDSIAYTKDTKENFESLINAELDKISGFLDQTFENSELGKWAKAYVQSLIDCQNAYEKEPLEHWSTNNDDLTYSDYYEAYCDRATALFNINLIQPVPIDENYSDRLTQIIHHGESNAFSDSLFDTVKFDIEEDASEGKKVSAVVENTSSLTFPLFFLEINILDKDGVVVHTAQPHVSNWNPGEKKKFEFSVGEDFADCEIDTANFNYEGFSSNLRY